MLHRRLGVAQFALCCQRCCISAVWLGVITLHVFTHIYWRQTRFFLYSLWKAFCPYMVFITSTVYPFTCVIDSFLFISALCFLFKPVKLFIWCILTLVIMNQCHNSVTMVTCHWDFHVHKLSSTYLLRLDVLPWKEYWWIVPQKFCMSKNAVHRLTLAIEKPGWYKFGSFALNVGLILVELI